MPIKGGPEVLCWGALSKDPEKWIHFVLELKWVLIHRNERHFIK